MRLSDPLTITARLQGFPSNFQFVSWHKRLVCNAIPPLLAEIIGCHIAKTLTMGLASADGGGPDSNGKRQ